MYRQDVYNELFGMIAVADRKAEPSIQPGLNERADLALHEAYSLYMLTREPMQKSAMRRAAMKMAVNSLRVVFSLDDALL